MRKSPIVVREDAATSKRQEPHNDVRTNDLDIAVQSWCHCSMGNDDDTRTNEILAAIVAVSLAGFATLVLWAIFG